MDYSLALKLKEAGFPQVPKDGFDEAGNPRGHYDSIEIAQKPETRCYKPHLEELIEACGDRFIGLRKAEPGAKFILAWLADAYEKGQRYYTFDTEGNTPSEAVANLWLALQK